MKLPQPKELWTNGINTCRIVTVAYEMPSMWEIVVYDFESGEPPYWTDLDKFLDGWTKVNTTITS